MNGESCGNGKRKGIHSLLAWEHMPATQTCNNQTHKTRKSFNTMEALKLLLAEWAVALAIWMILLVVLRAIHAVVLAIWMIVLLILDGVARMIDFLQTSFENEVKLPPFEVELPPVERLQSGRRVHSEASRQYDGGFIPPENAGLCTLGKKLFPFARGCALPSTLQWMSVCALQWMKKHVHGDGGREQRR